MSNVSLRVYNREIETMIEGGRLDEAVAHCQNILKTFPMYVEIYRLLGKSFLEARRYTDAADIFQRVIMAVPDDFVAHVGMSIIRDDEGKLDDAIWHMERAFEDQPSNTAIQNELRRLYGRRDGIEPPRIRLSRDALANMYAQGELFNQAITEIRAVLADDPNRPDLQVMLARAYYRSGQKVEAAEVAANLLKKYNYCLDALRVLVDVLPESSQTENTQVYRQRLHMLDPYSSFVAGSVFNTDQVADASVNLERLDYVAGSAPASPQPNWAATLGIKLVDDKRAEPAPDWLTTEKPVEKPVQKPVEPIFEKPNEEGEVVKSVLPPSEPAPEESDTSVPDWMRTAGWKEARGQGAEEPEVQSSQKLAEPLEQADIPEWLKSMAPQGIPEPSSAPDQGIEKPTSQESNDIPDWLKGLGTVVAVEATAEPSRLQPEPKDTNVFPDWLKEMDASASPIPTEPIPEETVEQPISQENAEPDQAAPTQPEEKATTQPESAAPAWRNEDTPFQPTGVAKPVKIEDDAMAWLESLAVKQGAKEEELLTKPGDRSEEMPNWLRPGKEQAETPASPEPVAGVGETLPLEPISQPPVETVSPEPFHLEISPVEPQVETTDPQVDEETFIGEPEGIQENPKPEEFLPENLAPTEVISQEALEEEIAQSHIKEEDSDAWLKDLMAEQNLHPVEEQSLEETPFEELGVEPPAEWAPLPFNLGEDTQARLDDLATGQVSTPEESQPISAGPMEEIPPENIPEKIPPPYTTEDDSKEWVEEFPPESLVPYGETPTEIHSEGTTPTVPSKVDNDAWSEGMAAPAQETGAEELPHGQLEQSQTQPEWMQTPAHEPIAPSQPPVPEVPSTTPEEDITITSWLSKHDVEAALGKTRPTSQTAPSQETQKVDLPDWLKEPEQLGTLEKPQESPTQPEIAPKADERIPEWLGQAIHPVDNNPETVPAPDSTPEEELPTWMDETTQIPEPLEPTTPGEWISAEDKPGQLPEVTPAAKLAAVPPEPPFQRQILGGTGMLSRIPPEDKDAEFLSAAQTALDAKKIKESMQAYAKLIKKNRLLDEVIHDLREAIYRFPVDISIWQMLGDAAMRANRLQDALDAYTKAEELLR